MVIVVYSQPLRIRKKMMTFETINDLNCQEYNLAKCFDRIICSFIVYNYFSVSFQVTSYGGNLVFTFELNLIQNGLRLSKRNADKMVYYRTSVSNYVKEVPNNRSWSGRSHTPRALNDVPSSRRRDLGSSGDAVSGPRILNLTEGRSVFIVVS